MATTPPPATSGRALASATLPPSIVGLIAVALVLFVVEWHLRPTLRFGQPFQAQPAAAATIARRRPSPAEIENLRAGRDLWHTLNSLRFADVTPEFAAALDGLQAAGPIRDTGVRRLVACYQARRPTMPLAVAIDALPADGPWLYAFGEVPCLIEVIAERAPSDPQRALPVLIRAARDTGSRDVLVGLARLDVDDLPTSVAQDLRDPDRRANAVAVAIALGAGEKWPREVVGALADPSSHVRATAERALAARDDGASQALLARHVAQHPHDEGLVFVARSVMANRRPIADGLLAVAGDEAEAADVRAHAAWLVSVEAERGPAERLAAIEAADPWLRARLADAVSTVKRRFPDTPSRAR